MKSKKHTATSNVSSRAVEVMKPDETAEVLDLATDPFATIKAAAKECGFPESTLRQLLKRMEARYQPLNEAIREVKRGEVIKMLDDKVVRCLEYLDDFVMSGASLRDLAVTAGIMIDKAQLLQGQPTEIRGYAEREGMLKKFEILAREAKRRGLVLTLPKEEYEETGSGEPPSGAQ